MMHLLALGAVLAGFGELAFFHAFSHVVVDKGALAVHEVELVVNAREDFSNSGGVGDHAAGTHDLGQVSSRNHSRWP